MYANIRTMNNNDLEKEQKLTKQDAYCMVHVKNFADKYDKNSAGVTF